MTIFTLMWGVPYLTAAQHVSRDEAGALLTVSVVTAIVAGILIGIFIGRHPHRRSWLVLGIITSNAAIWTVVLALNSPAPRFAAGGRRCGDLDLGGPGSVVGFDFARTFNPRSTLGTAQGADAGERLPGLN